MLHVAWKEQYSVQNPLIDGQHQRLLSILNDLILIANRRSPREAISELFHQLIDYAREHFTAEEQILKKVGYPAFTQHKAAHLVYIDTLLSLNAQYNAEDEAMVEEMINFLKNWLIHHILKMDTAYASYIKGNKGP